MKAAHKRQEQRVARNRSLPQNRSRKNVRVVTAEESLEDRELAGEEYRKDLILRFANAKLQHIDLCTTAYLHTKSGGLGAADLGLDPASESNAARHVRSALGLDASKPYRKFIYVPQWSWRGRREILPLEVRLPHEVIARDFLERPHLYDKTKVDPAEYQVEQFMQHPITMTFGESETYPIGYYTDKVALGKHEYFYRTESHSADLA